MATPTLSWFEIPVVDMDRAKAFYESIWETNITISPMGELSMGFFPWDADQQGPGGALVGHPDFYKPDNERGVVIYFASKDIDATLARVVAHGGTVLVAKRLIAPGRGSMGVFIDTEGNRIALYEP